MTKPVLVVVDLSNQLYRASSVNAKLTSQDGEFTGGLYGFLVQVAKVIRDTDATQVVVGCDSKPYKRSELYPEYKLLRRDSQDPELRDRVRIAEAQVLEVLKVIGVPVISVPGYEFDDIMGHIVHRHRHRYKAIFAASNDSDLYQLFTVCPWFKVCRRDDIMDIDTLRATTGLNPEQYMMATALMGTHNDVAGIPKVGIKTAVKAVLDPGQLRSYLERYRSLVDRNLRLIKLPYDGFPWDTRIPGPLHSFSHRQLIRALAMYDINLTSSMYDAFSQVCP